MPRQARYDPAVIGDVIRKERDAGRSWKELTWMLGLGKTRLYQLANKNVHERLNACAAIPAPVNGYGVDVPPLESERGAREVPQVLR